MTLACATAALAGPLRGAEPPVDFTYDVRPILSNKCFACHGPDDENRQGGVEGLRLDSREGAIADLGDGGQAVVPAHPEQSRLLERVTADDADLRMPPADFGTALSPAEVDILRRWIAQGAAYAPHWSYMPPRRPAVPAVKQPKLPFNSVDRFLLSRLESLEIASAELADRETLIRRVTLDLTGLPPTPAEVEAFLQDDSPAAYERLVDRLLGSPAYGEHFARMWLDLARYADSAGYADDPPRTIWGYRDWVVNAFNRNQPFDQFTIEQLAGDLLPDATDEQRIATAFHRNTLTNNEGGTNDEEFRNVAIIDRVNTTFAVWMGTTMACAQCHTHKYDPITQREYYEFFAILNSTADADRRDESPLVSIQSAEQRRQLEEWRSEIARLESRLKQLTPELAQAMEVWQGRFVEELEWSPLAVAAAESSGGTPLEVRDGEVFAGAPQGTDTFVVTLPVAVDTDVTGLRLTALPDASLPGNGPGQAGGNFVVTRVSATLEPAAGASFPGRFVRIELPGAGKMLSLAEVQVFRGGDNIARAGRATQSSTDFGGPPELAIDGNTNGDYRAAMSTTHTANSNDPWWEVDLTAVQPIDRIVVWNRTDGNVGSRLNGFRVVVLDGDRNEVWSETVAEAPAESREFPLSGVRPIVFASAGASFTQSGFDAGAVLAEKSDPAKGWAIAGGQGEPQSLTLIPARPLAVTAGAKVVLRVEQMSQWPQHLLGRFRIELTGDPQAAEWGKLPADVIVILRKDRDGRSEAEHQRLTEYFLSIAPELAGDRERLAVVQRQLTEQKPTTTVPVMLELAPAQHRETKVQIRGDFMNLGEVVRPRLPAAFARLPNDTEPNRLTMARWLVSPENPLTARVMVNRFWEKLFGIGLVRTSEEFGSQGELPSHPALLDWLAVEFIESGWDVQHLLRLMVTSRAYRQSSRVTPELQAIDPDNRLLARGPRFRLTAEMVRDQSLAAAGLLGLAMGGPPVRPPQPNMGLNAAFGGSTDWETSRGEDRYRRALYIQWRRSNPYPSMSAFDAPNREVCTLRRDRTNTPLQAFVTLNDPVYVEAAQGLGRLIAAGSGSVAERIAVGFRRCLARNPSEAELARLVDLYEQAKSRFAENPSEAEKLATDPLGPLPEGADRSEFAAWTLVGNVLLNLDEMLMKR
ncbi:MAG: DUF1553 domain-containing protein [Planctomycetaceae bacterium]